MPIDTDTLADLARHYAAGMPPIRGRRMQRLLLRTLVAYDVVVPAQCADGRAALLALADDGRSALCRADGRGPSADVTQWARLDGALVSTAHDMLKDSLPVLAWTLWHPSFERLGGALTIAAASISPAEWPRWVVLLASVGL